VQVQTTLRHSTVATYVVVHSKLDYCNSLYYNLSTSQLNRTQLNDTFTRCSSAASSCKLGLSCAHNCDKTQPKMPRCRWETARCRCKCGANYGWYRVCRQLYVSFTLLLLVTVDMLIIYAKVISQTTETSATKNLKSRLEVIQVHIFWHQSLTRVWIYRQLIITFVLFSAASDNVYCTFGTLKATFQ